MMTFFVNIVTNKAEDAASILGFSINCIEFESLNNTSGNIKVDKTAVGTY
jgi:hypothetical protein